MKTYLAMLSIQIVLVVILLSQQGCVPLITGIKEYKSGDTKISFISGFDVSAAANGIDTVDNNRGIKPSTDGYTSSKVQGATR